MSCIKIYQKIRILRKNQLTSPLKSRILSSRGKHNAAKLNRPYGQRGNIMSRNTTTTNATTNATTRRARKAAAPVTPAPIYDLETGRLDLRPAADLHELQNQFAAAVDAGFTGIDAKAAYIAAPAVFMPERPAEITAGMALAAENLAALVEAVRATLAAMGKGTGTSSIYNVLDGRLCHGVHCRKVATRLSSSRALATFIDTYMGWLAHPVAPVATRTSVHGVSFTCDRRQWAVRAAM